MSIGITVDCMTDTLYLSGNKGAVVGLCCSPEGESLEGDVPNDHLGNLSLLSGGCV